jgi:hypothetical protein
MKKFIECNETKIKGTLSCFDRMISRGYLPIQNGWQMASLLNREEVRFGNLKSFLTENGYALKAHAVEMAAASVDPTAIWSGRSRWSRKPARSQGRTRSRKAWSASSRCFVSRQ